MSLQCLYNGYFLPGCVTGFIPILVPNQFKHQREFEFPRITETFRIFTNSRIPRGLCLFRMVCEHGCHCVTTNTLTMLTVMPIDEKGVRGSL